MLMPRIKGPGMLCGYCDGSGEGRHDGEACVKCYGSGEVPDHRPAEREYEKD